MCVWLVGVIEGFCMYVCMCMYIHIYIHMGFGALSFGHWPIYSFDRHTGRYSDKKLYI